MTGRAILTGIAVALVLNRGSTVLSQDQTVVTAIHRAVKSNSPRAPRWRDAHEKDVLAGGDLLRTGRSSLAKLRFRDGSVLLSGPLSEVVINERDVALYRGVLLTMFLDEGTITGPYSRVAVSAARIEKRHFGPRAVMNRSISALICNICSAVAERGEPLEAAPVDGTTVVPTQVEYRIDGDRTLVRCYSGVAYVGAATGELRAGTADSGTPMTLVDDQLVGQAGQWVGATLHIRSGPNAGASRSITGFDPAAGTISVNPPFPTPIEAGEEYLLTNQPDPPVILTAGYETTVHKDGTRSARRRAFPLAYAGGEEYRWFDDLIEGESVKVYNATYQQQAEQDREWPMQDDCVLRGDVSCAQPPTGSVEVIVGELSLATARSAGHQGMGLAVSGASPPSSGGSTAGALTLMAAVNTGNGAVGQDEASGGSKSGLVGEIAPYAVGADPESILGGQARLGAISGHLRADVGGNTLRFNGDAKSDLSQLSLLYRSGRWGDLKIGRQHLFVGPSNNSRLGTLVDSTTMDGVIWRSPPGRRLGWRAGYLVDNTPLEGESYSGWVGRAQGVVGQGFWGITLLTASRAGGGLGVAGDLSLPLVPDRLDAYLEVGQDPFDRELATGGLYLADLYQRTGVNAFVEYQWRRGQDGRFSFRLSSEFARHWFLIGYLVKELNGNTSGGVGARFRWQWR